VSGDSIDEVYEKCINPQPNEEESDVVCPKCDSKDVDRSRGYRGEYVCRNCGHHWET
jgi:predicted RNA-binding Zn-ribbon protein involved in translation (DUF1610 family)